MYSFKILFLKRESKETREKRKEKTDSCIHLSLGNQEILVFSGKFEVSL